jgi:F0F1-type ATP synthase assembly protein I
MQNELPDNQIYADGPESPELSEASREEEGLSVPPESEIGLKLARPENNSGFDSADQPAFLEPEPSESEPYTRPPAASAIPSNDRVGGDAWQNQVTPDDPFVPLPYSPSSESETIQRSGLAWSAGIAFFGSVAFTLFLGWIADVLLGISPWGIVAGIVLGSIIGFLQFFRITSRIFPSKNDGPEVTPLMSRRDDE